MAVDDSDPCRCRHDGGVEKTLYFVDRIVGVLADDVDFLRYRMEGGASLEADSFGELGFRIGYSLQHLFDVVAAGLHFHEADFDFEAAVVVDAADQARVSDAFQANTRTLFDWLLFGGFGLVERLRPGDDGGLEVFAHFAGGAGDLTSS